MVVSLTECQAVRRLGTTYLMLSSIASGIGLAVCKSLATQVWQIVVVDEPATGEEIAA